MKNNSKQLIILGTALEMGDPNIAGKSIADIILFLLTRIPEGNRVNAIYKMINKIKQMDTEDISNKDMKPYSSVGTSLSFIKNVLSGHDKIYVRRVLESITRNLL